MSWQTLVKTALLGTEHSAPPESLLQHLQAQGIDVSAEPPIVLLQGAALYAQIQKAGFVIETYNGPLPEAAAVQGEKACSQKSSHHLHLILNGEFEAVLPEFLGHLIQQGKHFPSEHLPSLLRRADAEVWWQTIQPALGASGRWLLSQHPAWGKWLADYSQIDWRTGSREERIGCLRYWRKQNPPEALALLQSTWPQEDYRSKTSFLAELETGLNLRDEPFLESCLDDGRKEVRQTAARLLAKLAGSRYSDRMYRRAMEIFDLKNGTLRINLPDEPGQAALRDGLQAVNPYWGGGAKASYLGQLIATVDPDIWPQLFSLDAEDTAWLLLSSEWGGVIFKALVEASLFHEKQSWIDWLCTAWVKTEFPQHWNFQRLDDLARKVSPGVFNDLFLFVIHSFGLPLEVNSPGMRFFECNQSPWEERLGSFIVNRLKNRIATAEREDRETYQYKEFLKRVALKAPPSLYDDFQGGWDTQSPAWPAWEKPVHEMLNTLLFRKEMTAELAGP